jgi:RNA 2',3'-cyclic 3'-phosphodiesterase
VTYREKLDASSGRRLFVAIPIPPSVRESIASVVDAVRAAGDPTVRDVRWVRLDGLHLTVRFIGPTDEERVAAVAAAVERTARAIDPFDVVIAKGGAFPSVGRPRALWLGISKGAAELGATAAQLGDALADVGWPRDDRPYRAHLTLARSDGVRAGPIVAKRLIEAATAVREPFRAESLVLFESVSGSGPARYLPLHEASLGANL